MTEVAAPPDHTDQPLDPRGVLSQHPSSPCCPDGVKAAHLVGSESYYAQPTSANVTIRTANAVATKR